MTQAAADIVECPTGRRPAPAVIRGRPRDAVHVVRRLLAGFDGAGAAQGFGYPRPRRPGGGARSAVICRRVDHRDHARAVLHGADGGRGLAHDPGQRALEAPVDAAVVRSSKGHDGGMPNDMVNRDLSEELRAAERRLQSAQLASDVGELTELIDDALWFTGPDGNIYTKQDDLDAHKSGQQVLHRLQEEELRVLATPTAGVTWFLGVLEGAIGGEPFAARMRYTRTWIRDEQTGWKVVAAHASLITNITEEHTGSSDD